MLHKQKVWLSEKLSRSRIHLHATGWAQRWTVVGPIVSLSSGPLLPNKCHRMYTTHSHSCGRRTIWTAERKALARMKQRIKSFLNVGVIEDQHPKSRKRENKKKDRFVGHQICLLAGGHDRGNCGPILTHRCYKEENFLGSKHLCSVYNWQISKLLWDPVAC